MLAKLIAWHIPVNPYRTPRMQRFMFLSCFVLPMIFYALLLATAIAFESVTIMLIAAGLFAVNVYGTHAINRLNHKLLEDLE